MRYNVAQLLKGPTGQRRQYELRENIEGLDEEMAPIKPLVGTVTLMRTSQGILATGKLRTKLRVDCRRCLEPYDVDIAINLEEEFHPTVLIGDSPVDRVPREDEDEALLIDAHHTLDLCAGLCPNCGGNRNLGECKCDQEAIDPRWLALQELLSKEPES